MTTKKRQAGFSLIELAIASAILLFGVAAVVQFVPKAMQSNLRNRYDSTAVVIAQRLLDQMMSQALNVATIPAGNSSFGQAINLGGAAGLVGNPVQTVGNRAQINFTAAAVANYNFTYIDPTDATQTPYEIRWAVISSLNGTTVYSKRFIVGAWRRDPRATSPAVTVEGWIQK